ncbi:MAG: PAS-domain containing protein [Hyphomicrobium sp.]|nr:PAS-domain containing protein [Hyphomicrobium sp.]
MASSSIINTSARLLSSLDEEEVGISIFGPDLELIASNRAHRAFYRLPDHLGEPGASLDDLLRHHYEAGIFAQWSQRDESILSAWREEHLLKLAADRTYQSTYVRTDGAVIIVTYHALSDGGWCGFQRNLKSLPLSKLLSSDL